MGDQRCRSSCGLPWWVGSHSWYGSHIMILVEGQVHWGGGFSTFPV